MISIASAVAVVVAVVVGYAVSSDSGTAGSHARPSSYGQLGSKPSKPKSDEDQIRATLSGIQDAWNSSDYAAFISYACGRIRDRKKNTESVFTQQRNDVGAITFAIDSISIGGTTAKVEVTETFSNQGSTSETLDFLKEDDEWKLC